MSDEVIATVEASVPRRYLGMGMLLGLGALLLYIAFATPPALHWQVFLVVLGVAILFLAQLMWVSTGRRLELTREVLRDGDGVVLARVADVTRVDRGAFAFKPSNGFVLFTGHKQAMTWRPGLWWRFGRRVAVGGVTPGSQTKPMADILASLIAERGIRDANL